MSRPLALLVNLGTPAEPTAAGVRAFLREFLSDPEVVDWPRWIWQPVLRGIVLRSRPARVAELYRSIWSPQGSPLAAQTAELARAVAEQLGEDCELRWCYRYGTPSIAAELERELPRRERVLVLPLFPQRTGSSSGTIVALATAAAARIGRAHALRMCALEPADADYVEALAARAREAIASAQAEHLLVSFHGIPARYDRREGGVYRADCERSFAALLARLGWPRERATLAFQSRFGPERWLEPAAAACFEQLPRAGVRRLAVSAPGFLTDGLETLEELGVRGRESFLHAGGASFALAAAPAQQPALARALASRLRAELGANPRP